MKWTAVRGIAGSSTAFVEDGGKQAVVVVIADNAEPRRSVAFDERGLSVLELLVVVAVIGILSAIALPVYMESREQTEVEAAVADIRVIEKLVLAFAAEHNRLPDSLDEVGAGQFRDPWGNSYEYLNIQGGAPGINGKRRKDHFLVPVNSDFDLYSKGPDGESKPPFTAAASRDDIVRTSDGGFVGPVSDY